MRAGVILLSFFILLSSLSAIYATIPQKINFQGLLADSGGQLIDGTKDLTFRIYDVGGAQLWTETQFGVTVSKGLFSVTLGSAVALNLQFDTEYWIGVAVDGGQELAPRFPLSPSAYSLNTKRIGGIDVSGSPSSGQVLKYDGTQWAPATDIAGGTTGPAGGDLSGAYPDPTVSKIQGQAVSSTAPATNEVLKWNGTQWAPGTDNAGGTTGPAGGDLSGNYPDPTVSKIQGQAVSITAPATNEVLKWNGSQWAPAADNSSTGTAGGDLSGDYPDPTVSGIHGRPLSSAAPATNQILKWNGTQWALGTDNAGGTTGPAGGDLSGNYPDPTVSKIQGQAVSSTAPATNEVLKWNGTQWAPGTDNAGGTTGPAGGDLSGNYPDPTVSKIQGQAVSITAPATNEVLKWNGSQWAPAADNSSTGTAGGDLSGTYPNPTVDGIRGRAVSSTAPTTNQVLKYNGSQWAPAADNSSTGTAGGDLSGTYPNPTVDGIRGRAVSSTAPTTNQVLKYNGSQWAPAADNTGSSPWTLSGSNIYRLSGNVGIGTSSPSSKLDVVGNIEASRLISTSIRSSTDIELMIDQNQTGVFGFFEIFNGAGTQLFNVGENGKGRARGDFIVDDQLGINTTSPVTRLHLRHRSGGGGGEGLRFQNEASVNFWDCFVWATGTRLWLIYNNADKGWFDATTGAYNPVSDARLKTDFAPVDEVLPSVMQLQPKTYHFKGHESEKRSIGFVAQDVEPFYPELVNKGGSDGGDLYTLNYSGFGVIAIKAIQEQQKLIEAQQRTIDGQQRALESLEQRIVALEAKN